MDQNDPFRDFAHRECKDKIETLDTVDEAVAAGAKAGCPNYKEPK
jgi:hypothetical protein